MIECRQFGRVFNQMHALCKSSACCVYMQVPVSGLQARFDHCAAAFSLADELAKLTIFGGCPVWPSNYKTVADL